MLGVQFHNGKSSVYQATAKKHLDSASKLNVEKSLKYEQSKLISQDVEKILTMEIKKANELVQKIQYQLKKEIKESDNNLLNQLRQMEESIRRKNILIKELQQETNTFKNGNKKIKIKGESLSQLLSQQMRCNSMVVSELKKELDDKRRILAVRKKDVLQIYESYKARCKTEMKEVINLNKFKEIQQKKKKQLQKMMKTKSNPKKMMSSIWEDKRQEGVSNYQKGQNRIKDTLNHRTVAETALKTERKRHKMEMSNFQSKLQFLKDEAELIQQKIRTKEAQLANAEKRFSQSRNRQQPILSKRSRSNKLKTLG